MSDPVPFCMVATKNGKWAGVCSMDPEHKDLLAEFVKDFVGDGFDFQTCRTRQDWNDIVDNMPAYGDEDRPNG